MQNVLALFARFDKILLVIILNRPGADQQGGRAAHADHQTDKRPRKRE